MTAPSPLLTTKQAAAYLQKDRSWISRHAAELGASRVGRDLRFRLESLDAYVNGAQLREPSPEPTPIRAERPRRRTGTNPFTQRPYGVAR
jgi:excisionase family DNA binding protein